jgi:hypothetical protein
VADNSETEYNEHGANMKHYWIPLLAALAVSSGCSDNDATTESDGHHVWEHQVDTLRQAEAVAGQLSTQQAEHEAKLKSLRDQQ